MNPYIHPFTQIRMKIHLRTQKNKFDSFELHQSGNGLLIGIQEFTPLIRLIKDAQSNPNTVHYPIYNLHKR